MFGVIVLLATPALSATPSDARAAAILWLERNQLPDGSWNLPAKGVPELATAEALLALARSNRGNGQAAQRAKAWLLGRPLESSDLLARKSRALAAVGFSASYDVTAGLPYALSQGGIGTEAFSRPTSYDTALTVAWMFAVGVANTQVTQLKDQVMSRRRADGGWGGDGIPISVGPSDRTLTGEIVRALAGVASATELAPSLRFLSTNTTPDPTLPLATGALVDPTIPTLELASRLAGIRALGQDDAGLETELLVPARFTNNIWSTDPYVNALALIAVTTDPTPAFVDPAVDPDLDRDGIPDSLDPDRDGDGVPNATDHFPDDPTEFADTDNDGFGDNRDPDDDGDGIPDTVELANGTNPKSTDTDGDGVLDNLDPCPTIAHMTLAGGAEYGVDADQDGVCAPLDQCDKVTPTAHDAGPWDTTDHDNDGICDALDADDDNDGVPDAAELAAGTDPFDPSSHPSPGTLDSDGDGLSDSLEVSLGLSPFLADTDADGTTDHAEALGASPTPNPAPALDAALHAPPFLATLASAVAASSNPFVSDTGGVLHSPVSAGQSAPIGATTFSEQAGNAPNRLQLYVGFEGQLLSRDGDADGLTALAESRHGTNATRADTDGDGFVDGFDGKVPVGSISPGYDLNGDGKVDGELGAGTDPVSGFQHPGKLGDVAPFGHPDGRISIADALVELRLAGNPELMQSLPTSARALTQLAADTSAPAGIGANDVLRVLLIAENTPDPVPRPDSDADGIADLSDNCPAIFNPDQKDTDGDQRGDACDDCPNDADPTQLDTDHDGLGNVCDDDDDGDGWNDFSDNCSLVANPHQEDSDGNQIGDACQ